MDTALRIALLLVTSYFLGAIPFSYIAGKLLRGIDLREHGSGNLGAANTFRVLGKGAAVPVLLADIGKGYLAVKLVGLYGLEGYEYMLIAALVVIIGHNYSMFVGFAGGKGVGTTAGTFLAMAPCAVLVCLGMWILILMISKIVSVASMISSGLLPVAIALMNRFASCSTHVSVLYLSMVATLFVIFKHRANIRRLREGTEKRIF
jgi:glycerol-3-phosphate acyltransferase PlsY